MLDVEQILSNVDLGSEAPDTGTPVVIPATVTTEPEVTTQTPDAGQVTEPDGEPDEAAPDAQVETTPEQPAKAPDKTGTIPLAIHMDVKHKLRDAERRAAEAEARQMVAAAKPAEALPDKSPMEKFIEAEGGDAVPPAKVLMAQRQWEQSHQQQQQATQASDAASRSVAVSLHSMTDDTMGEGLGFETVLLVGNAFLTEGDKLDVRQAGDKAGEVLYQRCLERAIRSGTPQGKLLAAAVRQVRASEVVPAKTKAVTPVKPKEAPTREQVLEPDGFGSRQSLNDFFDVT